MFKLVPIHFREKKVKLEKVETYYKMYPFIK